MFTIFLENPSKFPQNSLNPDPNPNQGLNICSNLAMSQQTSLRPRRRSEISQLSSLRQPIIPQRRSHHQLLKSSMSLNTTHRLQTRQQHIASTIHDLSFPCHPFPRQQPPPDLALRSHPPQMPTAATITTYADGYPLLPHSRRLPLISMTDRTTSSR